MLCPTAQNMCAHVRRGAGVACDVSAEQEPGAETARSSWVMIFDFPERSHDLAVAKPHLQHSCGPLVRTPLGIEKRSFQTGLFPDREKRPDDKFLKKYIYSMYPIDSVLLTDFLADRVHKTQYTSVAHCAVLYCTEYCDGYYVL